MYYICNRHLGDVVSAHRTLAGAQKKYASASRAVSKRSSGSYLPWEIRSGGQNFPAEYRDYSVYGGKCPGNWQPTYEGELSFDE